MGPGVIEAFYDGYSQIQSEDYDYIGKMDGDLSFGPRYFETIFAKFDQDPYLRDIVERNLEVAAQCCIDISHRIITLEGARKPTDYYEAILSLGELGVLPAEFARHLAPLAGFRNILVHEYEEIDDDIVYQSIPICLRQYLKYMELINLHLNCKN